MAVEQTQSTELVYLNGEYLPRERACVSVFDRGFLFADGVYEVVPVYGGRPFHLSAHLARLQRSMKAIRLDNPLDDIGWVNAIRGLLDRNGARERDLSLYLQVTRGVSQRPRDHAFPDDARPTVLMALTPLAEVDPALLERGVGAVVMDDIRWARCDIKSIALLGNVLLRNAAREKGAYEALLVRDGRLTEGAASNVFVVQSGELLTPPTGPELLGGITRDVILSIARQAGISTRETRVPATLLKQVDEIWITSSTKGVLPVTTLDGRPVGDGRPGEMWARVHRLYLEAIERIRQRPRPDDTLHGGGSA